jgi:serine/threonine protein kinase
MDLGLDAIALEKKQRLTALPSKTEMLRDGLDKLERNHPVRELCEQTTWTVHDKERLGEGKDGTVFVSCRGDDCNYGVKRMHCSRHTPNCFSELVWTTLAGKWAIGPEVHDACTCARDEDTVTFDIFMDRLRGTNLQEWLMEKKHTKDEYEQVASGVARAIQKMHDHGLLHRDLVASNVFVELPSLRIKILDFRLAEFVGEGKVTDLQHELEVTDLCQSISMSALLLPSGSDHVVTPIKDFSNALYGAMFPSVQKSEREKLPSLTRQTASGERFRYSAGLYAQSADDPLESAHVDLVARHVEIVYRRDKVADVSELQKMLSGVCHSLHIASCTIMPAL